MKRRPPKSPSSSEEGEGAVRAPTLGTNPVTNTPEYVKP